MEINEYPAIIVGSGIAGLLTALKLADTGKACVLVTKTFLAENSSQLAQGGVAAVLPSNGNDSVALHLSDTLEAGAGLVDETIAQSVIEEGFEAIQDLIFLGVPFDRVGGKLAFTKEAAHSANRILHAGGDATGKSIQETLLEAVRQNPLITIFEECMALELIVENNVCQGVVVVDYQKKHQLAVRQFLSPFTIFATGGLGRLYSQTTNPSIATGDGVALAYQAGAAIQDIEFVQFHPTAFWAKGSVQFLISEALRGEGGILRDKSGRAFAEDYHPKAELAPRDIVTRAIFARMKQDRMPYVHLDITHLSKQTIETRFPNILRACLNHGVDIRKDYIPVAPAAHYAMGGVQVNEHGQTTINGLYAIGEVMSSGLHGGNRLASNSLLECIVFARRCAKHIAETKVIPTSLARNLERTHRFEGEPKMQFHYGYPEALITAIQHLRELMWHEVGILREASGLQAALLELDTLSKLAEENDLFYWIPDGVEFNNMLITARLICEAALSRTESRGAHSRVDYPKTNLNAQHTVQQMETIQNAYALS